jgi:hypothetical protein
MFFSLYISCCKFILEIPKIESNIHKMSINKLEDIPLFHGFIVAVERWRFRLLLAMLLVVLFTLPFLQYSDLGDFVVKVILTLMMIGTVRASDPGPRYVMKVTALGAVWLVLSLLHQFNS